MKNAAGSIVINTDIDISEAQKKLMQLKREIKESEDSIAKMQKDVNAKIKERDRLAQKLDGKQIKLDAAKQELDGLKSQQAPIIQQIEEVQQKIADATAEAAKFKQAWLDGTPGADKDWTLAQDQVDTLKVRYQELLAQAEKLDPAILKASDHVAAQEKEVEAARAAWSNVKHEVRNINMELETERTRLAGMVNEAGDLTIQEVCSAEATRGLSRATTEADTRMDRFVNRVKGLAKRVFVFSLITAALRSLRGWLGNVIQTNDEAAAAMARLKGALLTLAQPLLSVLIPALTVVINLLARLVTVAAQLIAMIFGKSIKQTSAAAKAMNAEKKAIEGVGGAAKDAAKNLSGLDEINTWDSGSSGGAGGGAGGGGISPDFDLDGMGVAEDRLKDILGLVEAIAAGLLTWKLSKMFGLNLGQSLALFAAIIGAVEFVKGLFDAWANGASAENVRQMLIGLTVAAVGLGIAFGPVAAGVALVVGGLAMLVTGFQDAVKNGFNLHNMLLTLSGIIATGLGISLLTGSVIPVLIASILALLVAIAFFTGHGEELLNGLRDVFGGFIDFITGVFSGDWAKAMGGIERMFQGLKMALGAIIDGVKDLFLRFLDWIDQKTNGKLKPILDFIRNCVKVTFDAIKTTVGNVVDAVKQIFSGIITFLRGVFTGNWKMAWDGIKSVFKGVWNGVVSILEGAVNLIIRGVNWLVSQLNKIHVDIPSWVPGIGGRSVGINIPSVSYVSIPRLAKGAVIPPNREFMAVLGDQKSGNNIETPESLLRQIVREEMSNKDGGSYRFTAQINRRVLFDQMIEEGKLRQVSTGRNPFMAL